MLDQKKSRIKRLSIWFTLNLTIFTLCYLNYRFQLKHRYLYRTLNAGLCFSRAAAMVINFNLVLVWIPMCKYTLTRLAYVANISATRQRNKLQEMDRNPLASHPSSQQQLQQKHKISHIVSCPTDCSTISGGHQLKQYTADLQCCSPMTPSNPTNINAASGGSIKDILSKLRWSLQRADWKIRYWFCVTKLNHINSFLVAVDHCTSLHTICATTITIASIIHTIAHLMNVINFSKNYDPLLGNLNMAEFRGQNPIHLLISVPGITGCFMIIILLLMSLSSIDIIRNLSFDLFQVFHRLSIVFVFLLILHPSSHVLKEQINVDRYHPELCHLVNSTTATPRQVVNWLQAERIFSNSSLIKFANARERPANLSDYNAHAKFSAQRQAPPGEQSNVAPKVISRHSTRSLHSLTDLLLARTATANEEGKSSNKNPRQTFLLDRQSSPAATITIASLNDDEITADAQWQSHGNINGVTLEEGTTGPLNPAAIATTHDDIENHQNKITKSDLNSNQTAANQQEQQQREPTSTDYKKNIIKIKVNKTIGLQGGPQPAAREGEEEDKAKQVETAEGVLLNNSERDDTLNRYERYKTASEEDGLASPSSWTTASTFETQNSQRQTANENLSKPSSCLDERPLFVAQSTICWYVLSVGLSCYLLDLLLRRLRRSRSTIDLLDFRSDCEGNLIELILSNNHKRFAHWLPGQFVYLNCPQIATHEWHPFTISSMDNRTRQFTLHIKTGGDWTRKLRCELELLTAAAAAKAATTNNQVQPIERTDSDAQLLRKLYQGYVNQSENKMFSSSINSKNVNSCLPATTESCPAATTPTPVVSFGHHHARLHFANSSDNLADVHCHVASSDCFDAKTGQLQIVCKSLSKIPIKSYGRDELTDESFASNHKRVYLNLDLDFYDLSDGQQDGENYPVDSSIKSTVSYHNDNESTRRFIAGHQQQKQWQRQAIPSSRGRSLDLFIDGPFHSPFERLLEQQVSVCIANGVGWTAFSSVFQCITNTIHANNNNNDWWSKWHNYVSLTKKKKQHDTTATTASAADTHLSYGINHRNMTFKKDLNSNLHLMIIVTTIEQLKPFYYIALRYFDFLLNQCQTNASFNDLESNPVREVKAFVTRSNINDPDVREFCQKEKLNTLVAEGDNGSSGCSLTVNGFFSIHFGKPNFEFYLRTFEDFYPEQQKISVYCCGSYQVKKVVEEICKDLNKTMKTRRQVGPMYSYHEENF